jgi:hypothetical protein
MIDQIIANKPKSIFEHIPEEYFFKYDVQPYVSSGNYYEWMYAISKTIQPTSFLEIGVRFGFSFLPVLLGSHKLKYAHGWDLETYGNVAFSREQLKEYYHGDCIWDIAHADSQQIKELPHFYDLINIDGCHDYDCKMHDLRLTVGKCKYVIIDDYDYLSEVKRAIIDFIDEVGESWGKTSKIEWATYIPTFRGSMLIKYKEAVCEQN